MGHTLEDPETAQLFFGISTRLNQRCNDKGTSKTE